MTEPFYERRDCCGAAGYSADCAGGGANGRACLHARCAGVCALDGRSSVCVFRKREAVPALDFNAGIGGLYGCDKRANAVCALECGENTGGAGGGDFIFDLDRCGMRRGDGLVCKTFLDFIRCAGENLRGAGSLRVAGDFTERIFYREPVFVGDGVFIFIGGADSGLNADEAGFVVDLDTGKAVMYDADRNGWENGRKRIGNRDDRLYGICTPAPAVALTRSPVTAADTLSSFAPV